MWSTKYPATQLANDAVTLKTTLASFDLGHSVFGPSYARIDANDTAGFLSVAAAGGIGYTVHNYPYGGHDCDIEKYLNKSKVTSDLRAKLDMVVATAAATPKGNDILLVLEETAGSSGGGCDGVTDRFVAGFTWLLTMNTVAESGFHRVHRQDIVGWSFAFGKSNYMLVGPPGWTNGSAALSPHPDYFNTILFKQLTGRRVLSTTVSGGSRAQNVSATMWCSGALAPYGAGSVVLVWLNLGSSDVVFTLPASLASLPSTRYTLTGAAGGSDYPSLASDDTYLNGALLTVDEEGRLPAHPIPGLAVAGGEPLTAGPYSYGFVAFDGATFPACAA